MSSRYEPLLQLYPEAVVRAGRVYPAAIAQRHDRSWGRLRISEPPLPPDPTLLRLGGSHLAKRLVDDPSLTNGATACWQGDGPDGVQVTKGRYLDMIATCDSLRAEFEDRRNGTSLAELPLRALAHELAGDPLTSGAGRDAAIGVSVILTVPLGSADGMGAGSPSTGAGRPGRAFVIGCRGHVSSDRGTWHVAPSGMLELNGDPDPIAVTVATELLEELGLMIEPDRVAGEMVVLGLVHDLLRLKPDLVVRLDLSPAQVPAELAAVSEFSELAFIRADHDGLDAFWAAHDPSLLTPAAAGAIALFEASLPT